MFLSPGRGIHRLPPSPHQPLSPIPNLPFSYSVFSVKIPKTRPCLPTARKWPTLSLPPSVREPPPHFLREITILSPADSRGRKLKASRHPKPKSPHPRIQSAPRASSPCPPR